MMFGVTTQHEDKNMKAEDNTLTIEDMMAILREKGITMSVGGCGCCGSPGVTFTYEGKTFDGDDASFDTEK